MPRGIETKLDELCGHAPAPIRRTEVRVPHGGGGVEVFADSQERIERILMWAKRNVRPEETQMVIECEAIEFDGAFAWFEVPGEHAQEGAFAAAAWPHHADHFAAAHREADPIDCRLAFIEPVGHVGDVEAADQIALFLDDAIAKVAAQADALANVDDTAVGEIGLLAHWLAPHEHRPVALQHFERPALRVVVADDPQQQLTPRVRRKQNVSRPQQCRVIGNEIVRLARRKREPAAEFAGAAAQLRERDLGLVGKRDLVRQPSFQPLADAQVHSFDLGGRPPQCLDLDPKAEFDLEHAVGRTCALDIWLEVTVDREEELCRRDILLGVEVGNDVLVIEDCLTHDHALAEIEPAEFAFPQLASSSQHGFPSGVFEQHKVAQPKNRYRLMLRQIIENQIGRRPAADPQRLERLHRHRLRKTNSIRSRFTGVELVNQPDRLGRHPQAGHEQVKLLQHLRRHARPRNQHVKLHPEQHFFLWFEQALEVRGDFREVLRLVQRPLIVRLQLARKPRRQVVAQEAQAGIDVRLDHFAFDLAESCERLDQQRQDRPPFAAVRTPPPPATAGERGRSRPLTGRGSARFDQRFVHAIGACATSE